MITLQHGRKKPQNGNKGLPNFDALSQNIDLDDSHNHNDVNSSRVNSFNLVKGTRVILDTDFTLDVPTGWYTVVVAVAAGYTTDDTAPIFTVVGGDYGGMQFTPTWSRNGGNLNITIWMPIPQSMNVVFV
jgi:hypothetical protein